MVITYVLPDLYIRQVIFLGGDLTVGGVCFQILVKGTIVLLDDVF